MSEQSVELRYMENEDHEFGDKMMLMELSEELAELLVKRSTRPFFYSLILKPDHERQSTVLCSSSKTYLLRSVSQTNSLLIFQKEDNGFSLLKDARSYLEVMPIPVRINFNLLAPVYDGYNSCISDTTLLYTLSQVKRRIPASEEEIQRALIHSMCLVINVNYDFLGYLRRLSFDYAFRVLQLILVHAQVEGISLEELKLDSLMKHIGSEEPVDIVELVLRRFSRTQTEPYVIDGSSVAQWIGIQLLSTCKGGSIPLDEFIYNWKSTVPSPFVMYTELSLLQGEYLLTESSILRYFPADALSIDPAMRFQELFLAKPKWNLPDILPFIRGIASDETKIDAMLRKFTRKQVICQQTILTARDHRK
ncbi:hypothetical protein PORY_002834 [Pneumocystis oryctolagi]|uniref:Uncharacterized protein n=1 Tax=Pneumocystis oryctolagi TaxID=42067 RepID=A0ACB7C8U5_9ASCO|nr:hypothetical protein PORY_002834 [Pneumocystis oryctolagi]